MPKVDRGGRWHATIRKKGNRWIDMPDRALEKLADLLEDDASTRDTATSVAELIDSNKITEAQDIVQKFIDSFPFEEIIAEEQDRAWTDEDGNETDQGPVDKVHEALQAFVDTDPAVFENRPAVTEREDWEGSDPDSEPDPDSGVGGLDQMMDEQTEDQKAKSAKFSEKLDLAREAIAELKADESLTEEQAKAVDRALKEIEALVAQVQKSKPAEDEEPEAEQPAEETDAPEPDAEEEDPAEEPREEEKPAAGPRHRAEDPAEESREEVPQETPDEPAESDPADADAQSEIEAVAKLKEAFEEGYTPADEHIWQGKRGSVEIGNLADGTKVVRKVAPNEEEADKEALIGLVANVLGIDVFTAKVSATELVTNHIQGNTGNEWLREQYNEADTSGGKTEKIKPWRQAGKAEIKAVREMKNAKEMGLLDYLVNNPDRHAGNWMVREGDEIVPIDHGNSKFESKKMTRDGQELTWFNGSPFMKYWLGMEVGKYKEIKSMNPGQHWDKGDLQQLKSKLAGLKDEFSSRPEWHDAIMGNIDTVLEHIK